MNLSLVAVLVFLVVDGAEALQESKICYILDGILFLYGIILTLLYCRLKFQYRKKNKYPDPSVIYEKVEGVYTMLVSLQRDREVILSSTFLSHPLVFVLLAGSGG
ncbi:high affinity immunoglobulin epsilon receptor subunit gamma isoform X2 [Ahaetulla prasina]|uniref:high affinity immunoglobulin epsilon receptor subunit gamma isoform X2 n=1 Tax=Ahaetulla prasina TaxID=499056 RepID=UPI00264872A9|nr:high affinity immunoglobulin epsilon receptor subunit gamma isoform X2 [Ahaetulla prasina]